MVPAIRSFTSGTQPPQPVPALVHFLMQSTVVQPSFTTPHMVALVTASHEQISASSGKLSTPAPSLAPSPRDPSIISSGFGGSTILLLTVCSSMLYASASPIRMPPSKYLPSLLMLMRL